MAGGRPIDIEITTNVDGVLTGAEKISDKFDDVQDSLKDTAKASETAGQKIEDSTKDAAKVIDRDLTKSLKDVADESKTTGKGIGTHVKAGTDKAGEGLGELKDESKSTAKEAAASFGSIEDAADALQEVAANAFAGFGPAGMAAGIVAAAGIGLAISALQDNADQINANKEKMLSLAQTIRDNGGALRESDYIQSMQDYGLQIQDTKEWFELFQQDAKSGFDVMSESAKKAGVSFGEVFKGQFGSAEDAKQVLDSLDKKMADLESQTKDNVVAVDDFGRSIDTTNPAIARQIEGNKELSDKVRAHVKELEIANQYEALHKEAIKGTTQELLENIEAQEKQTDATKTATSSELDYLDGVDNLNAKLNENGATLDKSTAAGRDNTRAVLDQASAIEQMAKDSIAAGDNTETVTSKFNAQKETLINQVMPAFGGARDKAEAYINMILKTPPVATTKVLVDDLEARNKLSALERARTAPLQILPDGSAVEKWYMSQQGRKIFVEFAPQGGGQAAQLP